ncbi:MAG: hypothetical protein NC926_05000 [Candidatus Omnitrophica bacterium]|nr:hypothetical protein [Candidatus Omnitrophota bacterium]MCM8807298.1 hypothetical protein [Candidatus Omnitrophota bacterium]
MKKKKKYLIIISLLFFAILVLIAVKIGNRKIDINKLTDEEIIELLKSDKIKRFNSEELLLIEKRLSKIPYEKLEKYFEILPENLKNKFEKNIEKIYEVRLDKKIEEFFNSSEEQQERILDEEIERLEKSEEKGIILPEYAEIYEYEKEMALPERRDFRNRRFFGRNLSPDGMLQKARDRLSLTTPQQRARRQEFMKRLIERRKNRPFRR